MADRLVPQLAAIGALLQSVKKAQCFQQVCAGQCLTIETLLLQEKSLSADAASQLIDAFQKMPWPQQDLDALTKAVARKAGQPSTAAPSQKMQNFEAVHSYFTATRWDQFHSGMAKDCTKDAVINHVVALGLRFPTEPTVQHLVGLYLMVSDGYEKSLHMPGPLKLECVRFMKKKIKEHCKKPPLGVVERLPANPRDFAR